jgi:cytochrome c-type biogenesis protein CcmH
MLIKLFLLTFLISSTNVIGDSLYNFENVNDEKRFYSLIKEIRCPKCTSGSLASSNAPVSEDIKKKIIQLIKEGKTDDEIKNFLSDRFGNEVLYNPGLNSSTYILWIAPGLFIFIAFLIFFFRRKT